MTTRELALGWAAPLMFHRPTVWGRGAHAGVGHGIQYGAVHYLIRVVMQIRDRARAAAVTGTLLGEYQADRVGVGMGLGGARFHRPGLESFGVFGQKLAMAFHGQTQVVALSVRYALKRSWHAQIRRPRFPFDLGAVIDRERYKGAAIGQSGSGASPAAGWEVRPRHLPGDCP